jgi:hypothetical protein
VALLVSDLIQKAYEVISVVQPGELISSALQTNGMVHGNALLDSLSAEKYTVSTQTLQTFTLTGVAAYTLGSGGSFATTGGLRAQRVISWRATNGVFTSGGVPAPFGQFEAQAQTAYLNSANAIQQIVALEQDFVAKAIGLIAPFFITPNFTFPTILLAQAAVPMVLAADEAFPLINIRVFPTIAAGSLELAYWTPITQFVNVGDTLALPPGWFQMMVWNLAILLYPEFARLGGLPPEIAANAQNSKAALVQQNSPSQ